jgi:hypothetical protein
MTGNVNSFSSKNHPDDLATIKFLNENYPKPGISKSEAIMTLLNKGVKELQEQGSLDSFTEEKICDLNGDVKQLAKDLKNMDNFEIKDLLREVEKKFNAIQREVMKRVH